MFIKLKQVIASWRGGKQPKPQSFNLEPHDVVKLNTLIHTNEWDAYLDLIDNVVSYRAEALLTCRNNADLHFLRGQIAALRELPLLVERMAKGQRDARDNRIADPAVNRAARRASALYATPSWPAGDE